MANAKSPNPFDDLRLLYQRASELLLKSAQPAEVLINSGAIHKLKDRSQADKLLAVLNKDVAYYSEQLQKLYSQHKAFPKKPRRKDDPLIFEAWTIGNEYIGLMDRMSSTLVPIASDIGLLIHEAATKEGELDE